MGPAIYPNLHYPKMTCTLQRQAGYKCCPIERQQYGILHTIFPTGNLNPTILELSGHPLRVPKALPFFLQNEGPWACAFCVFCEAFQGKISKNKQKHPGLLKIVIIFRKVPKHFVFFVCFQQLGNVRHLLGNLGAKLGKIGNLRNLRGNLHAELEHMVVSFLLVFIGNTGSIILV